MSQIDIGRGALVATLIEEYGFEAHLAAKAALAAHPLDDNPVPSRAFEKQVRKVSRQYGKVLRNVRGKPHEAEVLTLKTLQSYKELAIQHGEDHYINRYDKALSDEPSAIPPPESGTSSHRRESHEPSGRRRQKPWEPDHISRDEVTSRILERAVVAGYEDPDVSTPTADTYSSEFRFLLDEVRREFRLFEPNDPFDVEKNAPFRLSEAEIEQISVIGDLVDTLGKYIRKAHEAYIAKAQADAEELERLKQLADAFEADGIRVVRDSEGYPRAVIHPDSAGDSMYELDLDEMYDWTVEEIDVFVHKWVSESQADETELVIRDGTEGSVAESDIGKPALSSGDSPAPPQNELPEQVELWLANLAVAAGLPRTDLRCRWVFPPDAGFLIGGDRCRYGADAAAHETNHPYFGPDDVTIKTCQLGHRYWVPTEMPDWKCVRCRVDVEFPGWRPRGDIGVWDSVTPDQRP